MTIEHSDSYYDYKRNDPDRENPFTDPKDRARAEIVVSGLSGKVNVDTEKHWDYDVPWPVEEVKVQEVEKEPVVEKVKEKKKNLLSRFLR